MDRPPVPPSLATRTLRGLAGAVLLAVHPLVAVEPGLETVSTTELKKLSIEDLANLHVTSAGKKAEKLNDAAAAIHVITQDDLRRTGVSSIPDALRLVPGMNVASIDSHSWAISSRGFNGLFANKLLVLLDGRSVYTPLFGGVFWDVQDTLLDDLDRIEVIGGPGAALWGANAVNGVVNIISKPARETQGTLLYGGASSVQLGYGGGRYGGRINENLHYRVYGKYDDHQAFVRPDGGEANDAWTMGRGGFRVDWEPSSAGRLTLQGDAYAGTVDQTFTLAIPAAPYAGLVSNRGDVHGGNVLGRWTTTISDEAELQVQAFYDRTYRDVAVLRETRDTLDLELQHRFTLARRNDVVWGAGYRATLDDTRGTYTLTLDPPERSVQLFSAFVQDEITLAPDRFRLILGTKVEHNDSTGFEAQPNGRLLWTPHEHHSLWASVARALRTPSRVQEDLFLTQPGPVAFPPGSHLQLSGNRGAESEELIAYEFGYRVQPLKDLSSDLSLFYNDYARLITTVPGSPVPGTPLVFPALLANAMRGETYGAELGAGWQALSWWRLHGSYTFLKLQLHRARGLPASVESGEGESPQHQFQLRSSIDLPGHVQFDAWLRYVDALAAFNLPSYAALDLRLGWKPARNVEFSLGARNLLDDRHPEYRPNSAVLTQQTEVPRTFYGKVTLWF